MAEECPFVSRYVAHYLTLATVDDRTRAWSASQHWLGLLHGMSNIVRMCPWFISPRAVCRAVYLNDLVSLPLCPVTLVQMYYTECLNTSCDIVSLVNKERSRPERKKKIAFGKFSGIINLRIQIIIQISTIDRLAIKSIGQWIEMPIYVVFNLMRLNRWYPFQKDRATPFSEHLWFFFNRLLRSTLYSNGGDHKQNITDYVKQVQINIF